MSFSLIVKDHLPGLSEYGKTPWKILFEVNNKDIRTTFFEFDIVLLSLIVKRFLSIKLLSVGKSTRQS